MKKWLVLGVLLSFSFAAMAEINCYGIRGLENVELKVIDTFVDRTAFLVRIHPSVSYPLVSMSVGVHEKSKTVVFDNKDYDFTLSVNKKYIQRSPMFSYRALLEYQDLDVDMSCTVE
jgi:hypothetical protein